MDTHQLINITLLTV